MPTTRSAARRRAAHAGLATAFAPERPAMSRNGACVAFGAGAPRDGRFAPTGLFTHFTGRARAFAWQP